MRFDYLKPALGPVVNGLEDHEKIYALEQAEYLPLRTLAGENGNSAIYRCELTPEQRELVARGGDVLIEILHFGGPMAPSRVMLLDQQYDMLLRDDGENPNKLADWLSAQLKIVKRGGGA